MKTVVFDFFGVICSEIAPYVLPKYLSRETAIEIKRTLVHQADLGLISQDAMFEKLAQITGAPAKRLEEEFWAYARIDENVVNLIESLGHTHRVALLTNAIVPITREIFARHNLERLFETILVSSEEGMAKPDPAFYTLLLDRMGARPEDAVMIDDNPDNIAGAKAAGMQGILFESREKLVRELTVRYSIIV